MEKITGDNLESIIRDGGWLDHGRTSWKPLDREKARHHLVYLMQRDPYTDLPTMDSKEAIEKSHTIMNSLPSDTSFVTNCVVNLSKKPFLRAVSNISDDNLVLMVVAESTEGATMFYTQWDTN